ncbi:hypothetical protein Tco_1195364 [Tanacetum coccineum]
MISFVAAVHGMAREQERMTATYIVKFLQAIHNVPKTKFVTIELGTEDDWEVPETVDTKVEARLCIRQHKKVVLSAPASKTQDKRTSSSQLTRSLWFAATDLCSKEVEMVVLEDRTIEVIKEDAEGN